MSDNRPKPPADYDDNPPLDAEFWRRARPSMAAAALALPSLRTAIAELERAEGAESLAVKRALGLLREADAELENAAH